MRPAALSALALVFAAPAWADDPPARKPNVLFIVADDLGYADLSAHGGKECPTPHIDSIATGGVRFPNGYVPVPYCSPTRAALLTGLYPQRFGHEFNPALLKQKGAGQGLDVAQKTVADRLKAKGYATGLVGKWHQGEEPQFHPLARGFDEFFGCLAGAHSYVATDDPNYGPITRGRERVELKGYLTDVLADEATGFIDRHKGGPWFLYLAFNAVHTPMQAPAGDPKAFAAVKDPKRRVYLAMLARLDSAVGKVLDKVRAAGLEKDTLVVFLSDNGGASTKFAPNAASNAPLRGSKGDTWEGGVRVPFFVRWPGTVPAGRTCDTPVVAMDATVTALAAAGATVRLDKALDGVDLLPLVADPKATGGREFLFWRFGPQMAVRAGDWKLVRASLTDEEHGPPPPAPMLFNLKDDPGETTDVAAKYPGRVKDLQAAWDGWNATLVPPKWPATVKGKAIDFK